MKSLILCADDYGLTNEIGKAVRQLIASNRLSAVSCITDSPLWPREALQLENIHGHVSIGLHFNLTESCGNSPQPLGKLILQSILGTIDEDWIERELTRQIELFEKALGKPPDFVDGHQHVHIFPGIRQVVFRLLNQRYPSANRPWVRRINPSLSGHDAPLKALILKLLARGSAHDANRFGIRLSGNLYGLYALSPKSDFPRLMAGWIQSATEGSLIMCHPGHYPDHPMENLSSTRELEWHYLVGLEFFHLCQELNINLFFPT